MPTLLRVLKMLSEMTESETNKKKMGEEMSEEMNNKLGETISVMAASEERGESELPMVNERDDTPVSTTISTAGGPLLHRVSGPAFQSRVMAGISTPTVRSPCVRVTGFMGGLGMGARRALAARVCWC